MAARFRMQVVHPVEGTSIVELFCDEEPWADLRFADDGDRIVVAFFARPKKWFRRATWWELDYDDAQAQLAAARERLIATRTLT